MKKAIWLVGKHQREKKKKKTLSGAAAPDPQSNESSVHREERRCQCLCSRGRGRERETGYTDKHTEKEREGAASLLSRGVLAVPDRELRRLPVCECECVCCGGAWLLA